MTIAELFHVGFVVDDIAQTADVLGNVLADSWTADEIVQIRLQTMAGTECPTVKFRFSKIPPFVELIERVDSTLWGTAREGAVHHLAYWSDDIRKDSAGLARCGSTLLAWHEQSDSTMASAYHRMPTGLLVELVNEGRRQTFEGWIRGGVFDGRKAAGPENSLNELGG